MNDIIIVECRMMIVPCVEKKKKEATKMVGEEKKTDFHEKYR